MTAADRRGRFPVARLLLSLAVILLLGGAAVPAPPPEGDDGGGEDALELCAVCHQETVEAFARTQHALSGSGQAAADCTSCHGPGQAHVEGGGDLDAIVRPQLLPPRESSDGCLQCHQQQRTHFSARHSIHRLHDVGCVSCHNPHLTSEHMLPEPGADLCAGCHQDISAQFQLPRAHPLGEGGLECAACHQPHGSTPPRQARHQDAETCGSCHFEKRGPFIYEHTAPLLDGCSSCHQVHGSPNRHLLKHAAQTNLCYECHSGNFTPGWHSAPRFASQKCTACHTAIHGSNASQIFLED